MTLPWSKPNVMVMYHPSGTYIYASHCNITDVVDKDVANLWLLISVAVVAGVAVAVNVWSPRTCAHAGCRLDMRHKTYVPN